MKRKKVIHISKYVQGMQEYSRFTELLSKLFYASPFIHSCSYKFPRARFASFLVQNIDVNSMKSTFEVKIIHISKTYGSQTTSMSSGMHIVHLVF